MITRTPLAYPKVSDRVNCLGETPSHKIEKSFPASKKITPVFFLCYTLVTQGYKVKSLLHEFLRWLYWYPFRMIAERIPLPMTYPLVKLTARILFLLPIGKFRKIHDGFKKSFPEKSEKELRKLTYLTFENYLLNACEAFWYPKLNKKRMLNMVTYEGLEKIDTALKLGKGVILAHGHFGNEELLMPAIGYMGYTAHQLASRWEPEQHEGLLAHVVNYIRGKAFEKRIRYRESFPVNFHYVDKTLRPAIRCLNANEILLFAVDGREGSKWEIIPFLNRKARFSPGLVNIAKITEAVILPVFLVRQPDCRHRLIIHDAISFNPSNELSAFCEFFTLLESYITKNPEQYGKVYFVINDLFVE